MTNITFRYSLLTVYGSGMFWHTQFTITRTHFRRDARCYLSKATERRSFSVTNRQLYTTWRLCMFLQYVSFRLCRDVSAVRKIWDKAYSLTLRRQLCEPNHNNNVFQKSTSMVSFSLMQVYYTVSIYKGKTPSSSELTASAFIYMEILINNKHLHQLLLCYQKNKKILRVSFIYLCVCVCVSGKKAFSCHVSNNDEMLNLFEHYSSHLDHFFLSFTLFHLLCSSSSPSLFRLTRLLTDNFTSAVFSLLINVVVPFSVTVHAIWKIKLIYAPHYVVYRAYYTFMRLFRFSSSSSSDPMWKRIECVGVNFHFCYDDDSSDKRQHDVPRTGNYMGERTRAGAGYNTAIHILL